ncbi:uncharacterized protein TM35_000332390 [Trypanosoma theileri]|uniref:Uncharacterized protein n=1 Tax=Trypanosoma theileri TaxID=67003 RepID=A0A1X0NLY9_9TRYP|nr:uncharacterized protein TM35_000332390 [Trypanosoma theileri]ORC85782.1 hypothetical protein TM35_000332390 [Trypanosoma theileri]
MTTIFVQLRRVVYVLVLLQLCACVVCADDTEKKEGEKHAEKIKEWLKKVDEQVPGATACQKVGERNNEKYADVATNVWNIAKEVKESANTTRDLVKRVDEGDEVKRKLNEQVGVVSEKVKKSKEVIATARSALQEARVLVGCTAFLGNLRDLRSEKSKNDLKFYTDDLEEKNRKFDRLEWGDLINRTRKTEREVDLLVQNLTFSLKRSRGISNEVARSLGDALSAAEEAVRRFENVREKVNKTHRDYDQKVEEIKSEMVTAMPVIGDKKITKAVPSLIPEKEGENATKEVGWKETTDANVGASPVTGARVREYPDQVNASKIVNELNRVLEEEKENLKQKKMEEQKAFEEKKKAEIRRKEEERRAEEKVRRAKEEKARQVREEQEKKAREEKARREKAEAEKLAEEKKRKQEKQAEEEKARKAKEGAERAKNAKNKKDGSVRLALMHSPLLLLLLCLLGCTLVC